MFNKLRLHTTAPKPRTSPLPSLYRQQRTLTAAKNVTTNPIVAKALEKKQDLLRKRISEQQAAEKVG